MVVIEGASLGFLGVAFSIIQKISLGFVAFATGTTAFLILAGIHTIIL
jgi:hypothetical protein